jgi:hypothetical protein
MAAQWCSKDTGMRLVEYRQSETSDLVDAVFLDDEEHFWHLQLVHAQTPNRPGSRPRIQVETRSELPEVTAVAEGYRELQLSETNFLLMNTWFELMVAALRARSGADAVMRVALR